MTFQSVSSLVVVDKNVFLSANDGESGTELWITDGITGGTRLVKDIYLGIGESSPTSMIHFKNKLFLVAFHPEFQYELWSSDGTPAGTKLFADLDPLDKYFYGSNPQSLTIFNDHLYFTASNGGLYKTNGEEGNLTLEDVLEFGRFTNLTKTVNYLYYYNDSNQLKRTDGNTSSVIPMPEDNGEASNFSLKATDQDLFAIRTSANSEIVILYRWNEPTTDWILVKNFSNPGNGNHLVDNFTQVGSKLFFSVRTNFNNSPKDELWVTDGTVEGTELLKSFYWYTYDGDSYMRSFIEYHGTLYFRSGIEASKSMWKSDGTITGTMKFNDVIISHAMDLNNPDAVVGNEKLFFAGTTSQYTSNARLWVTDGTNEGTKPYPELMQVGNALPYQLTNAEELIFFITNESQNNVTLWSSEPSSEISVTDNFLSPISSHANFSFLSTLVNYCSTKSINILNAGLKELAISRMEVTGSDFVINGELPELLESGRMVTLNITFNPLSIGRKEAELTLYSNDVNEGRYVINLSGEANLTASKTNCVAFEDYDRKIIYPISSVKKIMLSNTSISELMPIGTTVGVLSIAGSTGSEEFRLTSGVGDTDNNDFIIEQNQLKTNRSIVYSNNQVYTVRIKGNLADSETLEEYFLIQISNTPTTLVADNCAQSAETLNYSLNDIKTNSAGHLFSISNDGRILRSTDQGTTWHEVNRVNGELTNIQFKNNVGYITGNGLLLKSEDNGANWFKIYMPFSNLSPVLPLSTYFIDENKGYVSDNNGELLYTSDGGQSWEKRLSSSAKLKNMWFWDVLNGITISGLSDIIKTKDGGNNWTLVNTVSGLTSLWFINQKLGFASSYSNLLRTRDGGESWVQVPSVAEAGIEKIYFVNDKVGYLIGSSFYKTVDGGETWKMLALPGPFVTGITNVNNQATGKMIATMRGFNYGVGRAISSSIDGGATWQSNSDLITGLLYSICFVNDQVGYVAGEFTVYKTTDKGITWRSLDPGPKFISLYVMDANNVLFSDGSSIYRTSDGGETIEKIYATDGDPTITVPAGKLVGVSENIIFAYNWQALYRSIDGGINWQLIDSGGNFLTQDVYFLSTTVGYRLELFGSVQKTIDSGATWQNIYTSDQTTSDTYNTIFFLNESIGFKGGKYLSKTTDGGITWERFFDSFNDVISINFKDEQHGFILTRNNSQFETSDGGGTWKRNYVTSFRVISSQVLNNTIYYTDEYGTIGKVGKTSSKPLQPGYIFGKENVCIGDIEIYELPSDYNLSYQWNSSKALINDNGSVAKINFPEAGEYNFVVRQLNGCEISEPRSKKVLALAIPSLELSGTEILRPGAKDIPYLIKTPKPATEAIYYWDVKGASDLKFVTNTSILVTWSANIIEATVSSLMLELRTGCRNRNDKNLSIYTVVGLDDRDDKEIINAYPNPTRDELNIMSNTNSLLNYKMYDIVGRVYCEGLISPNQDVKVTLRNAPIGIYILCVSDGHSQVIRKIVKN